MRKLRPSWSYKFFLAVFFVIGVAVLSVLVSQAYAANVAPTGLNSTATSTTGLTLNWTWGEGTGTSTAIYLSTNGTTYTLASSSQATTTVSFATTSLSVNTIYYFKVESTDGGDSNPATSTALAVYTLANAASAPTASVPTSTTAIPLTINANSNPAATEFAIYNSTDSNYLDATGAASDSAVWQATSSWSGISAIGLTANTAYQFLVVARNGNNVNAANSSASTAKYTLTNVPTNNTITTAESNKITVTWTGDATNYYVDGITSGTNSDWVSGTSHTFSSLSCATTYTYRVKGRNGDEVVTDYAATVSQTTGPCPGGPAAFTPSSSPAPSIVDSTTAPTNTAVINSVASPTNWIGRAIGMPVINFINQNQAQAQAQAQVQANDAKVIFTGLAKNNFQPGEALKFVYKYKNEEPKSAKVKVTRQLIDSQGKIVKSSTATTTLKPGGEFSRNINENLAQNLPVGDYTVKVTVNNGAQTEINSFDLAVEQMKNKYFVVNQELPTATDFSFDQATWNQLKSNVALPTTIKMKYSYTNNTGVVHTIKVVRQLVDQNGQAAATATGKWQMSIGKKTSYTFAQTLAKTLPAGDYTIRLQAYDWTTNELLDENNNFIFVIEER